MGVFQLMYRQINQAIWFFSTKKQRNNKKKTLINHIYLIMHLIFLHNRMQKWRLYWVNYFEFWFTEHYFLFQKYKNMHSLPSKIIGFINSIIRKDNNTIPTICEFIFLVYIIFFLFPFRKLVCIPVLVFMKF